MATNLGKPLRLRNDGGAQLQLARSAAVFSLESLAGGGLALTGGKVGIGTTSPIGNLDLSGPANTFIRVANPTDSVFLDLLVSSAAGGAIMEAGNHPMRFWTNGTERIRLTSAGYLKASNTGSYLDPTGVFHEVGQNVDGSGTLLLRHTSSNADSDSRAGLVVSFPSIAENSNFSPFLLCTDSAATRLRINSNGNVLNVTGTYGTISDETLKQDIVDAGSQWEDLKAVRFRKYRLKSDVEADANAHSFLGVVAQEIETVSPGLVDVGEGGIKSVKQSVLLMKAAVALQEAISRIEALETQVAGMQA